jgi:hypothetical protein
VRRSKFVRNSPPQAWHAGKTPKSYLDISLIARFSRQGLSLNKNPHKKSSTIPTKEEILAFIGTRPGKIGTREIARAFGLKNANRIALKRMLRELASEGRIESRRHKLHHPGTLPSSRCPTSPA